jgi:AraC-like DNA-binding protein
MSCAVVVQREHGLGIAVRAVRAPHPRLAPLLYRPLYGFAQRQAGFSSWLEPPRPALTMIIDLEGTISANGEPLPDAWLGGLEESYTVVGLGGGRYASIDLEFTPLGAYTVLGRPLSELTGACVALEDLFGSEGSALSEQVREAQSWDQRFDLLERFLLRRAQAGPAPTPTVARALSRMWQSGGDIAIEELAAELSCSRRYLARRFSVEVGISPKMTARQIRFAHVRRAIERSPARWAEVAAQAGYCDQSHLNRDFRDLAGTTPQDFVSRLIPGGGVIGDGVPFVQDNGSDCS